MESKILDSIKVSMCNKITELLDYSGLKYKEQYEFLNIKPAILADIKNTKDNHVTASSIFSLEKYLLKLGLDAKVDIHYHLVDE